MSPNVNYSDVVNSLKTFNVNEQQLAIADSVTNLPEDRKIETVTNAVKNLTTEQQKIVAAGILPPTAKINDTIWLIVIGSFAAILVGTVTIMGIGFFNNKTFEPSFLTVFTSVSAFLIGLFAKTPGS
jgi:hypothetical protein